MTAVDRYSRKYAKWFLILFALCFPLVGIAASAVTARFRNEITAWADPESFQAEQFARYRQNFGPGEFVLMAFPCSPSEQNDRSSLQELSDLLKRPDATRWFRNVVTSDELLRHLNEDLRLDAGQVQRRAAGLFVDPKGSFHSLVFQLNDAARNNRQQAFAKVDQALKVAGIDVSQVRFAGLGHDLYVLDSEGLSSPFKMVPWIILVAFGLTLYFIKDLALAIFINAFGIFTGCLSFTLIFISGASLNAILWPSPTLIMLLNISGCLHLLAYYRSALTKDMGSLRNRSDHAVNQMLAEGAKPVALCGLTTALGMVSLMLSSTRPVQQFGVFGSLSVVASCGLLLVLLPAWLTVFPPLRWIQYETATRPPVDHWLGGNRITSLVIKKRTMIIVFLIGVMMLGMLGVPRIKTGGNLQNFFPQGHQILQDAQAIESQLGPLSSIEVLLRFRNTDAGNDLKRLRLIQAIERRMVRETCIESVVSCATFAPVLTKQLRGLQVVIDKQKLRRLKPRWEQAGLVHLDPKQDTETWRLSARYSGLSSVDVPELSAQLKLIAETQYAESPIAKESLKAEVTGEFVLFDFVDRQFGKDLLLTYSTAFVLISVVVFLIVGSLRITLVCALPNLFPALVVLGGAGLLNQHLDVASLMTASLALGIAVDDTLHFVIRWRRDLRLGLHPDQAISNAMKEVGSAMVQTSVICGCSIFLYAFCGFLPTVRFGILLAGMLFAALVGDLLLLPALLSSIQRVRSGQAIAERCP